VHCGNTADLVESGNFTVIGLKEPTIVMDYMVFVVENPMYMSIVLFAIIFGAVLLYWILRILGVVN